ncbi:MAG: hypothetical protein ACOYLH_11775 [Flavobacteriales bacterium]
MKKYFFSFMITSAMLMNSCGDSNGEHMTPGRKDSLTVLPTSVDTTQQKEVTRATGEVMVAFKPMTSEMEKYKVSKEQMEAYEVWYNSVVAPIAKEKGRACSSTDDENIMLNLSKANRFTVQRSMYPEPFGLIITLEGKSPIVLHEMASREKIEAALK